VLQTLREGGSVNLFFVNEMFILISEYRNGSPMDLFVSPSFVYPDGSTDSQQLPLSVSLWAVDISMRRENRVRRLGFHLRTPGSGRL